MRPGSDTVLVYDEYLQLHRRPVSKLDLEERRRREAREKGELCFSIEVNVGFRLDSILQSNFLRIYLGIKLTI